jgi:Protein of unknown function (DUF3107)
LHPLLAGSGEEGVEGGQVGARGEQGGLVLLQAEQGEAALAVRSDDAVVPGEEAGGLGEALGADIRPGGADHHRALVAELAGLAEGVGQPRAGAVALGGPEPEAEGARREPGFEVGRVEEEDPADAADAPRRVERGPEAVVDRGGVVGEHDQSRRHWSTVPGVGDRKVNLPCTNTMGRPTGEELVRVDVRIGVTYAPKEIDVDMGEGADPTRLRADIESMLSDQSGVLWLTDRKGRQVGIPVAKVAYVDIASPKDERRIGFST